jgi:hypothetical protein
LNRGNRYSLSDLRRQFFADEDPVTDAFDAPARDRVERGSTQGFAGPEIEASMVQRTSDLLPYDQPFDEWTSVVGTRCTNCEELIAEAHKEDLFAAGLPLNHCPIWKLADWNSRCESELVGVFHSAFAPVYFSRLKAAVTSIPALRGCSRCSSRYWEGRTF